MRNRIAKGFDILTPFYDPLARLIIGKGIVASQCHFLQTLNTCSRILILGGGTGWLLDYLCRKDQPYEIDYIDISPEMLKAAQKRKFVRVNFITGTATDIPSNTYDGVITNFYLDMFHESEVQRIIMHIKSHLTNDARWVITDFVNKTSTHSIYLWWMYRFFRIVAKIQACQLPRWQAIMKDSGFERIASNKFSKGFISSEVYRLNASSH